MSMHSDAFAAASRDEIRRQFEARKLTQNGAIWPVRRPEMRHALTIRDRMVEDLVARLPSSGNHSVGTAYWALRIAGWTVDQTNAHHEQALAAHQDEVLRAKS